MAAVTGSKAKKTVNAAYKGYKDGTVDFLGNQVLTLTGYPREEFNDKHLKWTDIIVPEDQSACRAAFIQALKTDKTYMREYRIKRQDGEVRWIQEWGQIVENEAGEMEFVTGILMDISEQKAEELAWQLCQQKTGKYLTFMVGGQEFGLGILRVREIVPQLPITELPEAPDYMLGVINLRGQVIPVMDLRQKLNLERGAESERRCIIVVEGGQQQGQRPVGMLVEAVNEVQFLRGEDIEATPRFLVELDTAYVYGMAKTPTGVKILLAMDQLLGDETLTGLEGPLPAREMATELGRMIGP